MSVETSAIIWTAVAVVGAALSTANAYDAWLDLQALAGSRNGRRAVARANLRSQVVRAVKMIVWVVPGTIIAFDLIPPSERRGDVVVWSLVIGMILATLNSTLDRIAKRRLLSGYANQHPSKTEPA